MVYFIPDFGGWLVNKYHMKTTPRHPDHNQKIAKALTGRTLSNSHKTNISKALTGRTLSEETRAKIRLGVTKAHEAKQNN